MYKFSSVSKFHTVSRLILPIALLFMSNLVFAQLCYETLPNQVKRAPASIVPDDDVIVKPVDNELSFYQRYVSSDNSKDVIESRNQLQIWQQNQEFANQYGLNTTLQGSPYFVPTPEEKWEYFKDRYLRYLRRRGEQPLKDTPKNWYQEYRASNEVDTIDEIEGRFKRTNKLATAQNKVLPSIVREKEVSLWKETKFIFQPRLDQGILLVGFKGPIGHARAWVGINGETEINFQKVFEKTGSRVMYNYHAHSGEYFTSLDQHLVDGLYARYTSSKRPEEEIKDDNTIMLLYTKQF